MNIACPAPAGHPSTRQWLNRGVCVLPPSAERRMNEFSPVIRTSLGSTGDWAMRTPPLLLQRELHELVRTRLGVEIATGLDDVFELRLRDRQPRGDATD